ncbi:hypothetical protein N9V92_05290 [Luminiphilus sp.]|jgi:hypothetical protein|nr:hypothetical protein [Luminiphilus sp.]MDB3922996.1 hypothetical protein [Luminiphilus sp.]
MIAPLTSAYPVRSDIADETLRNPYQYFGTVRALGLSARAGTLKEFLDGYLNERISGSGFKFDLAEPAQPTVIMVISDFYRITGYPDRGNFRNRSLQFHVPVTRYECNSDRNGEQGTLQVFSYASNMWNALTSTELRGPLTRHALMRFRTSIEDLHAKSSPSTCFSMAPQVIGDDGEVVSTAIVSVQKREVAFNPVKAAPSSWDLEDLNNVFAIKQFQHQKYPTKVCYESLVQIGYDNSEMESRINWRSDEVSEGRLSKMCVRIRQDAAHPIVETLGLKTCDSQRYQRPENRLRAIAQSGNALASTDPYEVEDHLLAPTFYQVMAAGSPVKSDVHEATQQLQTDLSLLPGAPEQDLEGGSIKEAGSRTLCYRYRNDLPDNGWIKP